MPEEQGFQVQFDVRLVPADEEADVSGYVGAGQVTVGDRQFNVFFGNFGIGGVGGVQGIAAQGIAAQGIAGRQGIAAQGIAGRQGIASQGIAGRQNIV